MKEYCFEERCKGIPDWRFEIDDSWFYSCAAHLGSIKLTLLMLGLKVDWVINAPYLSDSEIYRH